MIGISNNAVRAIAVGYLNVLQFKEASVILLNDGTVKITGGYKSFAHDSSTIPISIPGLSHIIDIKGNNSIVYCLDSAGQVFSFGREIYAGTLRLGAGLYDSFKLPTKIIFPFSAAPIVALSSNNDGQHALALDENGNVYGWGYNGEGAVGAGSLYSVVTPALVATNVVDIFAGETFSYILKADGTMWATGQSGRSPDFGSIWMNLSNIPRFTFTQIDPTIAPMNLCAPIVYGVFPLQLLRFTCIALGNTARLAWQSGSEQNFSRFVLEYSADGKSFEGIATIAAKGNNSSYSYEHRQVSGTAFYRLRMIDKDGSSKYSDIRSARFGEALRLTIAPNPTSDIINIYRKSNTTLQSVQVLSISGKVLETINGYSSGQSISLRSLTGGTYIIKIIDNNGNTEYAKVLKL